MREVGGKRGRVDADRDRADAEALELGKLLLNTP
jgi:hypothetical protein